MNYQQSLDYLYSFIDSEHKTSLKYGRQNYDLRRVTELLVLMGNPHLQRATVHIAGTKGKGSTAAMITAVLINSGYRTGLFSSPHLIDVRERFQVNSDNISREDFTQLMVNLKPLVSKVNERATYGLLTTFEVMAALAFSYFARKQAQFQVLEVGMGGELDATNVIIPDIAVITPISYDHMRALGNTLAEIASAKAGIIKPDITVISAKQQAEAEKVVTTTCRKQGARLIQADDNVTILSRGFCGERQEFRIRGMLDEYHISLPLLGSYQRLNLVTAIAVLEELAKQGYSISRESIEEGLSKVTWPGRFQIVSRKPWIILDGAHNPESATRLREAIKDYFQSENGQQTYREALLIIGFSRDKNYPQMLHTLAPLFKRIIATGSQHPRALNPEEIVSALTKQHTIAQVMTKTNIKDAISYAKSLAADEDLICITGSLFLVGEALALLKKQIS